MKKLFLDLDGTLAMFNEEENGLERFESEKGFFANLGAFENIEVINKMAEERKDLEIYVISASPNAQADEDKKVWCNKHLEKIAKDKLLLCRLGVNKAEFIKDTTGIAIDKNCILLDDYGHNLVQWAEVGGTPLKRINDQADNSRKVITREIKNLLELLEI